MRPVESVALGGFCSFSEDCTVWRWGEFDGKSTIPANYQTSAFIKVLTPTEDQLSAFGVHSLHGTPACPVKMCLFGGFFGISVRKTSDFIYPAVG